MTESENKSAAAAAEEEIEEEITKTKPENPENPKIPARGIGALSFWAYFTISISLLTLLLSLFHHHNPNPLLSFPDSLRRHFSNGKLIKLRSLQLFAVESQPKDPDPATDSVLLLHGLGSSSFSFRQILPLLSNTGLRALAVDLPGSGFSDKPLLQQGASNLLFDAYAQIRDKGIFWAFDHLVETGEVPPRKDADLSAEGFHLRKVLDEMSVPLPVHLVLHDSALATAANWVSADWVRSVTLIDSTVTEPASAFPFQLLQVPVLGSLVLRSRFLFSGLLKLCCSRSLGGSGNAAAESYRLLMSDGNGRSAVVEAGKALNYSIGLAEWTGSEDVKGIEFQVLWSSMWSDRWIEEGRRVATAIPQANFAWHSGGRWPQEDDAEEIAGMIAQFVSSLPKSVRQIEEKQVPDDTKRMFHEDQNNDSHGHGQEHATDYLGMYGHGQEWGS